MKCPCYNCEERHNLCHNQCKDYKDYINEKHKVNEWLKKQRYNAHVENIANRQRNRQKGKYSFNYRWWKQR